MHSLSTMLPASARSTRTGRYGGALAVSVLLAVALSTAAGIMLASRRAAACSMSGYKAVPGLTAVPEPDGVGLTWDGDPNQHVRLRLAITDGTPAIRELAIRRTGAAWVTVAGNATPDFRVASGLRRITNQQLDPLAGLGVEITPAIVEKYKWEAFWDAPLNIPGGQAEHNDTSPPQRGVLTQPGLPRSPDEVRRAAAVYQVKGCEVVTNGARVEVGFPGVQLGVFTGRLQYTVYKGTNLIRLEVIAKTDEPSVAYKYDAGIRGLAIQPGARMVWRDNVKDLEREHRWSAAADSEPVVLKTNKRVVAADVPGGSIVAFPPPHTFFWAREASANLGYNWYRQDSASSFSFGIRQAEAEAEGGEGDQNFALYSARPGTSQRMPLYLYPSVAQGAAALDAALTFTRGDRFKALPGYQTMATHFHMGLTRKAQAAGGLDAKVPDLEVLKAAGITIVAPVDGGGATNPAGASDVSSTIPGIDDEKWFRWSRGLGAPPELNIYGRAVGNSGGGRGANTISAADETSAGARAGGGGGRGVNGATGRGGRGGRGGAAGADPYSNQARYYETARLQSSKDFVVMPNAEILRGDVARSLGGHSDILFSHPVYWTQGRAADQPLSEPNPTYGMVYHIGTTADMMEMTHRENLLVFMPHPRSKGSTGFPDGIKDTPHFLDASYRGIGIRWGMGLDGSERRLCEYRCLALFDDMNNWVADKPTPPKFVQAISELYGENYGDDVYANNPVNYVRLATLPAPGDWTPIINAMKSGDYFFTSGEVLIPSYAVQRTGNQRTIVADVEWTFPLEFVEVVWGDGQRTDRQIIPATDLPAFGKHQFRIPFDAAGKKWVRFAAWDSAGNGALVQPIKLVK
jgi:hypothetical protein